MKPQIYLPDDFKRVKGKIYGIIRKDGNSNQIKDEQGA